MFLNLLEDDEKRAFAVLAERMIAADGIVVGRETATLAALKGEMGVELEPRDVEPELEDIAAVFSNRQSKMVVLLELMGLGYSDTSYCMDERSMLVAVAEAMGIGDGELARLEVWVQQHMRHVREALALMR
jgi:hypothetical protein